MCCILYMPTHGDGVFGEVGVILRVQNEEQEEAGGGESRTRQQ
jgi:hypothetical protein